jgi:asparagine synthase (glutamine-hydrolysing)
MQAQSSAPIKTFSIGFNEDEYNEAPYAAAIARHLGTDHHELYLNSTDALEIIPRLPHWYDEPFADSSQIPTYLVSKLARTHVTVSLSGDGGDELFAGYNRYFMGQALWNKLRHLPQPLRRLAARIIHRISPQKWSQLSSFIPVAYRPPQFGDKLYKAASLFEAANFEEIYERLIIQWNSENSLLLQTPFEANLFPRGLLQKAPARFVEYMQYVDTLTYLPEDILTKVDRAGMAVSLEGRVPLLDHRIVEYAWTLPPQMKIRHNQGKWLLRQVLKRYIPETLFERPKMGFGIPLDRWLRGPLREWAEDLLDGQRLTQNGLNPIPIRHRWQEHLSEQRNWQYALWNILMYQAWKQNG